MKIHIVTGFLGSGKTTFINKWLPVLEGEICIVENEFGDINIDKYAFPENLTVKELHAGCICCTLVGELKQGIKSIYDHYKPDHLIIEPSGVAALSDVLKICKAIVEEKPDELSIESCITLVDVTSYEDYSEGFGPFYTDQIMAASMIVLSHNSEGNQSLVNSTIAGITSLNSKAPIIVEDWVDMPLDMFSEFLSLAQISDHKVASDQEIKPADQVLESYSVRDPKRLSKDEFDDFITRLPELSTGKLLRAKGYLEIENEGFVHFNFTPYHREWTFLDKAHLVGVAFIGTELERDEINNLLSNQFIFS